jgi:tRNA(Ile)-lysidine synthase
VQKKFESNIAEKQLFSKQQPILLAVSGGIDSVVVAHLLKKGGFNFSMSHCNFKLRAEDSEADETFCKELAKKLGVKFYTKAFNVDAYCKKNKLSIQMAARELRYDWFKELIEKNKFDHLVTAHHANDVVETIFINLTRGTGINGLKGIPEKTGNIVRPLLNFTKEEIAIFAEKEKIEFRTDKSNLEAKYERNFLRLKIIPELKKLHPNLEKTFLNNVSNFKEEAEIVNDFIAEKCKELLSKKRDLIVLNKVLLKKEKQLKTILHYILEPLGFNITQINDIITNIKENGEVGKLFNSQNHTLTIDRDLILIKPLINISFEPIVIHSIGELKKLELFNVTDVKDFKNVKSNELVIEKERLNLPLTIRQKQTGDKFKPFGMKGFKLVSDLLKDQKLNAFEKEKCLILENGNGEIIWVIGYRSDDRYKITEPKNKLLKLSLIE